MLLTKRMTLALTLCFAGVGVFAQTADDIINKEIDALGGKAKLAKLNSVYEEMTTSVMGQEIPGKVWIVNNKGMRTEMSIMNQKMITVVTTDTGWMVNPMTGGDPQPLPVGQFKANLAQLDLRGQLMDYKSKGYTATLLGKEAVNGKECYKIKVTKTGEQGFTFFVDATTYLIARVDADVKAAGQEVSTEVDMGDYQKTPEGYVFPHSTTIHVNAGGGMEVKTTIEKLTVNPTVDPALFQKP